MSRPRQLGHTSAVVWRGFAMRHPLIAGVYRRIAKGTFWIFAAFVAWVVVVALVAGGFAAYRASANDPRVLSEENKHFSILFDRLPAPDEPDGRGTGADAFRPTAK